MARATIINKFGKMAGWNNVTINMLGRDVEGITEVDYDDGTDKENIPGAGSFPVGRGDGNYSAKCSLTLYMEEVVALQRVLPPGRRITDIPSFDINVHYDYDSFVLKDRIRNCEFTRNSRTIKQGDKVISIKFDLIVSHIDWNIV
jgi:hypothetical protein